MREEVLTHVLCKEMRMRHCAHFNYVLDPIPDSVCPADCFGVCVATTLIALNMAWYLVSMAPSATRSCRNHISSSIAPVLLHPHIDTNASSTSIGAGVESFE